MARKRKIAGDFDLSLSSFGHSGRSRPASSGGSSGKGLGPREMGRRKAAGATPVVVFRPDGAPEARVRVEVARTDLARWLGLMFRDHLEPGSGMVFLYERQQQLSFWMHDTFIPLYMIFINANKRVVGVVESAEPLTDDPRQVAAESQFVVEVSGGWTRRRHIVPGTHVRFLHVE